MPAELKQALADTPDLRAAFAARRPGRQRAYLLHFAAPRQASTRASRVGKHLPRILAGQGRND